MGLFLLRAVLCIGQSVQKRREFFRDGFAQNLLIGPAQPRAQRLATGILLGLVPRVCRCATRSFIPPLFGVIHHVTPDSWRRLCDLCPMPGSRKYFLKAETLSPSKGSLRDPLFSNLS